MTTVVLVDDHELARRGVRSLLGNDATIKVVGEAGTCGEAISLVTRLRPEVVILDMRLRDGSGLEVSRAIRKLAPGSRILVLSAYDDSQYVISMIKVGASGYLTKSLSGGDLAMAVHCAAGGWLVLSPDVAGKMAGLLRGIGDAMLDDGKLIKGYAGFVAGQGASEILTEREADILRHVVRGLRNRDIAEALGISVKTVEVHMHRILLKLGARNRSQAIVKSLCAGYVKEGSPCPTASEANTGVSGSHHAISDRL